MRLELHKVKITDIRFGDTTGLDHGVLTIDKGELQGLLEQDKRLAGVEIALARPGEKCRILQVADVVEPRAKSGEDIEGALGSAGTHQGTGEGTTWVLQGAAIVLCDSRKKGEEDTTSMDPRDHIIDMHGPGSEISHYGKTFNIVILPKQKERTNALDYQAALKIAGLKTAHYLAATAGDVAPDDIEIYDLPPLTEITQGIEDLPRVAYIFQVISLQYEPIPGEPVFFGSQAGEIMPTILHPNQVLDGAVTSALPGLNVQTYWFQNHPIIKELYRRHGKDLCFTGVIATTAPNNVLDFDRMANIAARLAKEVLGAEGVVLTKTGGGAPELAMARTAQRCEQLGMKTAIAMLHMGADIKDIKYGASTIFSMPEVDAIVSMGFPFSKLALPPVERVIGNPVPYSGTPPVDREILMPLGSIYGTLCQLGSSKWTAVRH